ncbi:hypothetical protein [Nocardia wallacei]|uniref:hypothetical protein n=1 Tax=Nocardia wallacei TaxID=480035 RepID=UPI00245499C8|nr:hypothetical protein [Nocardia wallacei]
MDAYHEFRARLGQTYRTELDSLRQRFGPTAKVVDTGGGCMAIEAEVGTVPGTDSHPLQLLVTTVDNGLAIERDGILHWYACLYDADDSGEALADGHDVESFDTACNLAFAHLRDNIPPSEELCSCLSTP